MEILLALFGRLRASDGKSLLETLKKYITEFPKNAKNEGMVQPVSTVIVSFLRQAIVGPERPTLAPSLRTTPMLQHV